MNTEVKMPNSIVINIGDIDTKSIKKQENFLQEEAYENLIKILKEDLEKNLKKNKPCHNQRTHNSIFINGHRGSGKTQFLLSIKNYIKVAKRDSNDLSGLYFFSPIDPTLLHDNESFLTIIIAKVLNSLEKKGKLKNLTDNEKKSFYQNLNNISNAIDGVINNKNKDKTSLEYIAQDQTSLKLEEYMHEFFEKIIKILGKKRLVLLIDDVDMAIEQGFKVLEVIRKYLSSPYIIPIVTGDEELYMNIVENYFLTKKIDDKSDQYAKDYLIKVLPLHRRVQIKTVYELSRLKNNNIYFKYNDNDQDYNLEYFHKRAYKIFKLDESAKIFVRNLFSNPLRRIIQFLHAEYINVDRLQFNLVDENSIENIEKKYHLTILKDVITYQTYIKEGLRYFNKNDFKEAIEYFDKSLELKETSGGYFYKGNSYSNLEEYDKAITAYKKVIELHPKGSSAYLNLGVAYNNLRAYDKAIEAYEKAIELNPKDNSAYFNLGNTYGNLENNDKAIEAYEKAIELNPKDDDAYFNLGLEYGKLKAYDKAIGAYEKAIELNPKDDDAYYNLGAAYNNLGAYDKAIGAYEKAIELNPKISLTYFNLGNTYNNLEKYDKAIEAYEKAIELNPKGYDAYSHLGNTYNNLEKYDKVIEAFEKVIELNPKDDDAYFNLGVAYGKLEAYDKAIKVLEKASELNPENGNIYTNLLEVYFVTNQFNNNYIQEEFLDRFKDNDKFMKIYSIIDILSNYESTDTKIKIEEWIQKYKSVSLLNWNFDLLKIWANKQAEKELLLEYIEIFEKNI